jgi:hypothetical protein
MREERSLNHAITRAFFEALQSGLWSRKPDPALFKPLTSDDWSKLYKMSALQTVEGVVCDGLQQLPAEALPPKGFLMKWIARLQQIEERNAWMNGIIADQVTFFTQHGLHPILQKGQGVAQFYDRPSSRCCGDIDWYFDGKDEYKKAALLMQQHGQEFKFGHGYSSSYKWKGCEVEHHQALIELRNPLVQRFLTNLSRRTAYAPDQVIFQGVPTSVPHPFQNIILINAHILKHMVVYGVGVRQLCDAARLYDTVGQQLDPVTLKDTYRKLGMLKWIYSLHDVLVNYIGLDRGKLPFDHQPADSRAEWMMEDILRGGNFGMYDTDDEKKVTHLNKRERINRFFHRSSSMFRLAPGETFWSPFTIYFSKIHR